MQIPKSASLIPRLLSIQDHFGYLPKDELEFLADDLGISKARVWDVASFFPHFRQSPGPDLTISVCRDMSCHLSGAPGLLETVRSLEDSGKLEVRAVSCLGRCDGSPVVRVARNCRGHGPPRYLDRRSIGEAADGWLVAIRSHLREGTKDARQPEPPATPARWEMDIYDPANLEEGEELPIPFAALKNLCDRRGSGLIDRLELAGLVGLGGALGRTGKKWKEVLEEGETPKFVVANGDESEPATFKDRELLLRKPHLVVEGVALAGVVLKAARGYIYVRHEYEAQIEALRAAIARAKKAVPEAFERFELEVFVSPGGYICGEQSALLEAIEGRRSQPRDLFPSLQTNGLFDRPTLLNNVETLAWVPGIALKGGEWYASLKRRLFSICGDVAEPGVHEVTIETTLGELIKMSGGMREKAFKGVAASGPSGGFRPQFLPTDDRLRRKIQANIAALHERAASDPHKRPSADAARLKRFLEDRLAGDRVDIRDLPLDGAIWRGMGLNLGAGIVIYAEGTSMAEQAVNCLEFFREESCGKCSPCRLGTQKLVRIAGILRGQAAEPADQSLIERGVDRAGVREAVQDLAGAMEAASICSLGRVAANPLASVMDYFGDEFAQEGPSAKVGPDPVPEPHR
jgi:NADH:ubiquinone oxidoreductase subunit F (NADH-binding)/NADH:ubiquinone oxidoreductase subunit E